MPWPSTPAAPLLAETFSQAASSVAGAHTLSIRLYQRPPLTPLTSADTMRTVQTEASTHDQLRASAPCVALAGTAEALCASFRSIPHPPSYPPSLGTALLSALFTATAAPDLCGLRLLPPPAAVRALCPVPRLARATGLRIQSRRLLDLQSPPTSSARTSRRTPRALGRL